MANNEKENKEKELDVPDIITAVKEEFNKLFEQQKNDFDEKLRKIEKANADNIRAIIAGRKFEVPEEKEEEEKTPEEELYEKTLTKLKNKGVIK